VLKNPNPYQEYAPPPQGSAYSAAPPPPGQAMPATPRDIFTNITTTDQQQPHTQGLFENKTIIDRKSTRLMMMVTIAFLFFYILIVGSKLFGDFYADQRAAKTEHLNAVNVAAVQVSTIVENSIIWINNGISEGQTPAGSARLIAKSPDIQAVVILDSANNLIASFPDGAQTLADTAIDNIDENGIKLTSAIAPDGHVTAIVIKRTGNYFAVAALADNTLLDTNTTTLNKIAIIDAKGRVIAGDNAIGKYGLISNFNVTPEYVVQIVKSNIHTVQPLTLNNQDYQIASARIPNSGLVFLEAKPKIRSSTTRSNLTLFSVLFLGTCALVWMLLNSLFRQLTSIRNIQRQTEISQQRFKAAAEGDGGGVWEVDLANDITYLSASLSGLLGLENHERTMPVSEFLLLFHPQDRDRFLTHARRIHIHGEFDFDVRAAQLPLILQCRGKRSGRDVRKVIVGVALDITEQRRAQASLKSTEARLHNALSSMTDSFVVWDAMRNLVIWNVRFEDFIGCGPGILQPGMDHASVVFLAQPSIQQVKKFDEQNGLKEIVLKDGRWIRYIVTQTTDGGHVSVGTDITEIRLREADLQKNQRALQNTINVLRKSQSSIAELAARYESEKIRAEEASSSKSSFLANMSHELRTPLNAINGFSDIMKKEMFGPLGDERYKEYISDILFSGQHLLALINDILDMSKIEAGKMSLNSEIMFMHEMITQVIRIIRGRAEAAQLDLHISNEDVREIEADPRAVKQILLNLLTNAIKFTPEGGKITVELIEKRSGLIVKVIDNGIGISQENIDRLVKPFEQVSEGSAQDNEGTGLGLALSKSLVELHGGNFKIESQLGKGTTIVFSLPNKPIPQKEEPKKHDVSQEISRLTHDISQVLGDDEEHQIAPETPETNLYEYQQPQYSSGETANVVGENIPQTKPAA